MKPFADFDTIANAKSDESRARESSRDSIFQVVSGHRAPNRSPSQLRWSGEIDGRHFGISRMGNIRIPASAEGGGVESSKSNKICCCNTNQNHLDLRS